MSFLLLAFSCSLLAQSGAGVIQGTVKDQAGAVIPDALIHIANQDTGLSSDTHSNSAGFYAVPSLFTGNYTLTFNAPGMKTYQTSIALQVGQTAVINPTLTVGSAAEQVTVSGNSVQLATYDSPTISSDLDNNMISQLPMNGRSVSTLLGMTTPGLESMRPNGNEAQALEVVQDGASLSTHNSGGNGAGGTVTLPDPDTVQEVRTEMANSDARFSTPSTSILTTKSGTNKLHGTFFETARNNYIGVAKARQDASDLQAPHLVRNEFGASLGGPVLIPKLYDGKDKTFFFFAYERYSLRSASTTLASVPTEAMRNGDFSALLAPGLTPQQLYDNQTSDSVTYNRQPFANNQIPSSRISPLAKKLYSLTPLPNNSNNPFVSSNLSVPAATATTIPQYTIRLDHNFNDNNRTYLRYTSIKNSYTYLPSKSQPPSLAGSGFPAGIFNMQQEPGTSYTAAIGYTHIFSSTFSSETILNNQWSSGSVSGPGNGFVNYEDELGLPNNFGENGFNIYGMDLTTYDYDRYSYSDSTILTGLDQNFTKVLGRHQLFFGGRYRHERMAVLPDQSGDYFYYGGLGTANLDASTGASYGALANTGSSDADFYLGDTEFYNVNLNPKTLHYRDQEFDTYFQENFHVNSRLVLNAGVRWEIHPALSERNNANVGFDLKNHALVLGESFPKMIARGATTQAIETNLENLGLKTETPQDAGLPSTMIFNSNFMFAPRLGIAYTLFDGQYGTVVRGGYGRYIFPIPFRNFYSLQADNTPYLSSYTQDYTAANQAPDGLPNYILRAPQTVVAGQNSSNAVDSTSTDAILPGDVSEAFLNPHFSPNTDTQANATIEQPMKGDSVLRVTYLYNHGSKLDQFYQINASPSSYVYDVTNGHIPANGIYSGVNTGLYDQTLYGGLAEDLQTGFSTDHSLELNFQHLKKSGYAYQIYYVYSRAWRVGGNGKRDSMIYPVGTYAPGLSPVSTQGLDPWAAPDKVNRAQNYGIDTAIPEHRISFNGIVDLPVGRGKLLFGHVNRFVDELIGGYQIAGDGTVVSQYFSPSTTNWGGDNPLGTGSMTPFHVYKHSHKVSDCRSGQCYEAYQWFNGFINPLVLNNPCGASTISGIPASSQAFQTPINMTTGTITCSNGTAITSNSQYLSNKVPVALTNGQTINVTYSPGPSTHPFTHTVLHGPFNYNADLSIYKVFPITESMNLKINMDAFNAFNIQGYNNPNTTDGIESLRSSYWTPRQVQFTARLTF